MIREFRGEHAFLSNFYTAAVEYEGIIYPTAEHAFQAAKTDISAERERIARVKSPNGAKMAGKRVTLRPDWDHARLEVMRTVVRTKFKEELLRQQLLATGSEELVEGNVWHDRFWGRCFCDKHGGDGLNWLGRILMSVREEIQADW